MVWLLTAIALAVHIFIWGAAPAVLLLPRRWERLWPWLAPLAGLALQSSVVYVAAAFTDLPGTDAYAWPSLLLPFGMTAWIVGTRGRRGVRRLLSWYLQSWPIVLVQLGVLLLLLLPLVRSDLPLTSVSLGSCDAADYASGVRVFQEFSADDRTGFMGHTEVVEVGRSKDFFSFWLRLNHFAPAAAMALNASILGLSAHEIVTVFTAVLVTLLVPVVFLVGRGLFRFRPAASMALAAAVGASPLLAYAVYQAAPAQLLATMGTVVLNAASIRAFKVSRRWSGLLRWSGVVVLTMALLAASYNFILTVALSPAVAWVIVRAWQGRRWRHAGHWLLWLVGCGLVVAALLPLRFVAMAERFALLEQYDFGWKIPGATPMGWLGALQAPALAPATGWLWLGGMVLVAGAIAFLAAKRRWRGPAGLALFALAGPPLAGYAILLTEAAVKQNNASYDAYKLLCVFLPFVVGGVCPWLRALARRVAAVGRIGAGALAVLLVAVNVTATAGFHHAMIRPPHVVDAGLVELAEIESIAIVDGLNMRIGDFWSRLWANAFLLRKRQYFATHTYEARRPTPLRARYDLRDRLIDLDGPPGEPPIFESQRFEVLDRQAPWYVDVTFGRGWFSPERYGEDTWRWSEARPAINLRVGDRPLRVRLRFDLRAVEPRELLVALDGVEIGRWQVEPKRAQFVIEVVALGPGAHELVFDSPRPPTPAPPGDTRSLLVALFGCTIEVLPASSGALADTR